MSELRRSPLYDRHVALGAKLADFGGWEMPIEYGASGGGVLKEHAAVREAVGVFDVTHLGKALVSGPGAAGYVNATLSNDLGRIGPGQAQYTLCCDDASGGVVDDLIAYLYGEDRVFLVPNAANTAEVVRRLSATAPAGVSVRNLHGDYGVLAVQGPRSADLLAALGLPTDHGYMSFTVARFDPGAPEGDPGTPGSEGDPGTPVPVYPGIPVPVYPGEPGPVDSGTPGPEEGGAGREVVVCRTGYTGEHGYELLPSWADTPALWDALLAAGADLGVRPCGLGARDTLRTEMGYPLHGQDLSLSISPLQARCGWAVGWDKPAFWGRAALLAERKAGPVRLLWGLSCTDRGIPRPHMPVLRGGMRVGEVTSGTFSPTLRHGIALALLDTSAGLGPGDQVVVEVRGRESAATVVKPPFVQPHTR